MNIKQVLEKLGVVPDPLKDQFFLTNEEIIKQIVKLGELTKTDVILEIGAGTGLLTKELAKKAGKVIAFEIDPRFKIILAKLPQNVELHYEDAWNYIQLHGKFRKKKEYNKIVSNLPYSFCEKFLHNLTFLEYDKAILLVPMGFIEVIKDNYVFSSFFKVEEKFVVDKKEFYPVPRTNSIVIDLKKLPDPLATHNLALFLRQYIYQREDQKTKNSLREGLIDFAILAYKKKLTKREAKELLLKSKISIALLDLRPGKEIYDEISNKFNEHIFNSLQ